MRGQQGVIGWLLIKLALVLYLNHFNRHQFTAEATGNHFEESIQNGEESMSNLGESVVINNEAANDGTILERQKRPYRLIPVQPKEEKNPNNKITIFKSEPTSTFLEIETEMPTTIKKKKVPKCGSNLQIFLLKNENNDNCLKAVNGKSLSMSKCSKSSPEQHWTRSNSLGQSDDAAWEHVCLANSDKCLTTYRSLLYAIASVELKQFLTDEFAEQKWMIGKTGQLYNMATDFSLAANLKSPLNPLYYTENSWDFEMEHFLKESFQKWSFIPVKDKNNKILCTQG